VELKPQSWKHQTTRNGGSCRVRLTEQNQQRIENGLVFGQAYVSQGWFDDTSAFGFQVRTQNRDKCRTLFGGFQTLFKVDTIPLSEYLKVYSWLRSLIMEMQDLGNFPWLWQLICSVLQWISYTWRSPVPVCDSFKVDTCWFWRYQIPSGFKQNVKRFFNYDTKTHRHHSLVWSSRRSCEILMVWGHDNNGRVWCQSASRIVDHVCSSDFRRLKFDLWH